MTDKEKKVVAQMKKDFTFKPGTTDEQILASARFVEFGGGPVFNSEEEYWAAVKAGKIKRP